MAETFENYKIRSVKIPIYKFKRHFTDFNEANKRKTNSLDFL